MSDARVPGRLPKLPFYLADLVLSAIAVFVLYRLGTFEGPGELGVVTAALFAAAIGAWFSIIPWLRDHHAEVKVAESANLASALEQIQQVEKVADQIKFANSQWQGVQDSASRTLKAASEISDKMQVEAQEFTNFLRNAQDQERAHLRLEVEKMKRAEADWLKVLVQMMDHVYALQQAGERSGQPALVAQLNQFQNACRDVARRIGLAPFVPALGEPYEERSHTLPDAKFKAPEDSRIGQVLATGYTYQGQMLRRALVLLANPEGSEPDAGAPGTPQLQNSPAPAPAQPQAPTSSHGDSNTNTSPAASAEPDGTQEVDSPSLEEAETQNEDAPVQDAMVDGPPWEEAEAPAETSSESAVSPEEPDAPPKTTETPEPKPANRDFADPFEEIEPVDWEDTSKPSPQPQQAPTRPADNSGAPATPAKDQPENYPRQLPLV